LSGVKQIRYEEELDHKTKFFEFEKVEIVCRIEVGSLYSYNNSYHIK